MNRKVCLQTKLKDRELTISIIMVTVCTKCYTIRSVFLSEREYAGFMCLLLGYNTSFLCHSQRAYTDLM